MTMSKALSFDSVSKNYGSIEALKNLSLNVKRGEKVALLGCNGAGKSTLLNIVCGLCSQDSGVVEVLGGSPLAFENRKKLSILPQQLEFPKLLKGHEVLKLIADHRGQKSFQEIADQLEISHLLQRPTYKLSGGEQRKLGLACAIIGAPEMLILDEPSANVDFPGREQINTLLKSYFAQNPEKTLIFSSHLMQEVERIADRIIVLQRGSVVMTGTTREVKEKFGLKKVRFMTQQETLEKLPSFSSTRHSFNEGNRVTLFGPDSDDMLRELVSSNITAKHIQVEEPSLDEIFLKIWSN